MESSRISRTATPCPATTGFMKDTIGIHHFRNTRSPWTPDSSSRPEADDVSTGRQMSLAWEREIVGMATWIRIQKTQTLCLQRGDAGRE
eukprot:2358330-Lingulodinium_polyedra.AAC.1